MHRFYFFTKFFRNRELSELYICMAIRSFAVSMIGIFLPLYLYNLNYSIREIFLFFAVWGFVHLISTFPLAKFASKFGFKHSIVFSVPMLILFYLGLYSLNYIDISIYVLAIIYGLNTTLFWTAYHVDFAKNSDSNKRGEELSYATIFVSIMQVAGPFVGGLILTFFGFNILFVVVSIFLLIATVPLFFSEDIHDPVVLKLKDVISHHRLKTYLGYLGFGVEQAMTLYVWPLFVFILILNDFAQLGSLYSIALFFSLVFTYFLGKYVNTVPRKILRFAAFANAIVWGLRMVTRSVTGIFIIDSIYGVTKSATYMSFDALSYRRATRTPDVVGHIIFREIIISIGVTLTFLVLSFLGENIFSLIAGPIGALLIFLF